MKLFFFFLHVLFLHSASAVTCRDVLQKSAVTDIVTDSLEDYRRNEIADLSTEQIQLKNADTLGRIEAFVPPATSLRARAMSLSEAQVLIPFVQGHEVAGREAGPRYQRENVEIGYCFGRATLMHLLLLRLGLQKESILKVWAVGPMSAGNLTWGFHVSILAYVRGQGWMALDPNEAQPQALRSWMIKFANQNSDKKLRFYITEPDRFTVDIKKYNRLQMGIGLTAEVDWYRNYFSEMLAALRGKTLEQLGLKKIETRASNDILGFLQNIFTF